MKTEKGNKMTNTAISITRALVKVKHLEDQIEKAILSFTPTRVVKGLGDFKTFVAGNEKIEVFEETVRSDFQSIQDMMKARDSLKAAINLSNSLTKVVIGGNEMTVAEAIDAKSQIAVSRLLINRITQQYTKETAVFDKSMAEFTAKEESTLSAYGSRDKAPKQDEIEVILKPLRNKQQPSLSNVLDAAKLVKKLTEELQTFEQEVDFVLSESNATTKVEV